MCTLFSGAGIWYANFHEKQNFVCPWGTLQKEFLNMDLSRRGFIGILGAAAAAPRLFAKAPSDYDPDLTVLLSDIHVNGVERDVVYQREKFAGLVAEILKLNPLPARAVVFGDLAWLYGRKEDYLRSLPLLKQLEDAGIPVTICMGNHDRRSTFLEVHPSYAKRTLVPGRIVTVCDAGAVDFLMLDGLQGTDDRGLRDMGPGFGLLDKNQQDWLLAELPKRTKPFFVCSHFPVNELKVGGKPLSRVLVETHNVIGYIHGHDHRWYKRYMRNGWRKGEIIKRSLCLPSTGHWGDIGYTLLRTRPDRAVASLVQKEFYFPAPPKAGEPVNLLWTAVTEENRGQTCTFPIPKADTKA